MIGQVVGQANVISRVSHAVAADAPQILLCLSLNNILVMFYVVRLIKGVSDPKKP
jgi:hypothetical protein